MPVMTVTVPFKVHRIDRTIDPNLDAHLDRVMECLVDSGAEGPLVTGSLTTGLIDLTVEVDAESAHQALDRGFVVMRAAIEAAGGRLVDALGQPIGGYASDSPSVRWEKVEPVAA